MHEGSSTSSKNTHLVQTKNGIILHLGSAIEDLEKAINAYKDDLNRKPHLKLNAWKYYKKQLPIMPIKPELINFEMINSFPTGTAMHSSSLSGTISPTKWFE